MENSLIALAIPPLIIVPAMGLLSRIRTSGEIGNELKRKVFHVGAGLTALSFPLYLTSPWIVIAATVIIIGWMIIVRTTPSLRLGFGACLHDSRRESYGEIYFALSLALLLLLTANRPLLYFIPVLILTFADAAAAIVGRLFPLGRFCSFASGKTACGSATFFVVALLITDMSLLVFTDMGYARSAGAALIVAAVSCATEMVCKRGIDNALIPVAAYTTLLILRVPQVSGDALYAECSCSLTTLFAFV